MNFFKKNELNVLLWSSNINAEGKTSLLCKLKDIDSEPIVPKNYGINKEDINFNGVNLHFTDIGNLNWAINWAIKGLRSEFVPKTDVLIYLIDSSKPFTNTFNTFDDSFDELQECIKLIKDKPLLIVITKIDIREESTIDIIREYHLEDLYERNSKFGIIETSTVTSTGIKEILYWLSDLVQ